MAMTKKHWIIIAVFAVIAVVLLAIIISNGEEEDFEIYEVEIEDLKEVVSEVGKVVAVKEIDLIFPMQGTVSKVLVDEGDFAEFLDKSKIPPGQYFFPSARTSEEMKSDEFRKRMEAGPWERWPSGATSRTCPSTCSGRFCFS